MSPFTYARAADADDAILKGGEAHSKYLGGGTNLVDLLRETLERPKALVDVTALSSAIEERADGSLLIGAAAKNTAVAEHRAVRTRYPALSRAIVAGASAQIRNMATMGGNLLQRTRCTFSTMTTARAATSACPARGATPWRASTASTRSWELRRRVSPRIPRTCASRWRRSEPSCICVARVANARCR